VGKFGIDSVRVIDENKKLFMVHGNFLGFLKKFYYDYSTGFDYPLLLERDKMIFTIIPYQSVGIIVPSPAR
jgi:hypothetical protein